LSAPVFPLPALPPLPILHPPFPTPYSPLPILLSHLIENDVGHLHTLAAGLVAQAGFAAMLQIQERQPQIQRVKWYKMLFVQVVNRPGPGEVQRAEINLQTSVFRLHQQRQALGAADQRAGFVDRTTVINQQRAGYPLALSFEVYNFAGLLFHTDANWSGQRFDRRAR